MMCFADHDCTYFRARQGSHDEHVLLEVSLRFSQSRELLTDLHDQSSLGMSTRDVKVAITMPVSS